MRRLYWPNGTLKRELDRYWNEQGEELKVDVAVVRATLPPQPKPAPLNLNFFERFPKYLLDAPSWPKTPPPQMTCTWPATLNVDVLYVFGLTESAYGHFQPWLHEDGRRRLIFIENDPGVISHLIDAELFRDAQVDFELLEESSLDRLAERYPSARVEVVLSPRFQTRRFQKMRQALLHKTALSSALFLDRLYGDRLFGHFLQNAPRFEGGFYANGLENAFADVPAIVCGAGPSLEAALDMIRRLDGKALILAGGSAITALSSAGIEPHFGVAVDPNIEEFERFRNSFFDGALILSTRVHPGIFATCNGPFGYLCSGVGNAAESWWEKTIGLEGKSLSETMPKDAMSVTMLSLAFAAHLGCKTIILAGMDLAYTHGKRYAKGVCSDSANRKDETPAILDRLVHKKSKTGKQVTTAVRWVMEANTIAQFAKAHPQIRWINATPGGLSIEGIEEMAPDAVQLTGSDDLRAKIAQEIAKHPMPDLPRDLLKPLHESLVRTVGHLEILAGKKVGSKALAEWELQEELAVEVLFYDVPRILAQAENLGLKSGFELYLEIAERYT